jgi:flagellar motor switch protein FliN/FliY
MPTDLKTILKLRVPVIVQVGQRSMPLDDILALGPGAIVELTKSAEEELDLLVNNKQIGRGTAVKVGENFGIRITKIGTPRQRVEALGQ